MGWAIVPYWNVPGSERCLPFGDSLARAALTRKSSNPPPIRKMAMNSTPTAAQIPVSSPTILPWADTVIRRPDRLEVDHSI